MSLKHRVKKIEKAIVPPKERAKTWFISEDYYDFKDNTAAHAREQKQIKDIKAGKIQHKDGGYWQEGDTFFIIARCFTDIRPDDSKPFDKGAYLKDTIKDKIRALKKERANLAETLKENDNNG